MRDLALDVSTYRRKYRPSLLANCLVSYLLELVLMFIAIAPGCATIVCAQCTGLGDKPLNSCCQQANPANCFANYVATADNSVVITSAPATFNSYQSACFSLSEAIAACAAQTPGFGSLDNEDAASCLCYQGTTWIPDVFDGYASSCAVYLNEQGDVTDAAALSSGVGLCSSVGNVLSLISAPASTTTGSGTAATSSPASAAATATGASQSTSTPASASKTGGAVTLKVCRIV